MKEQLGNFRVLEQIDKGGDTVVYRAEEDMGQGIVRPAAIKVLQTLKLDDEEQMTSLKQEVGMLLAVSNSPNIVTVFGFGVDDDEGAWIAMELAGKSLKHFVTEKPADPDQVRVLLRDALQGLRVCHSQSPPILHRDLKPNNILSNNYGTWQIADFGLARPSDSSDTMNVMTVKYAAPEMLDAQLGEDSSKLDIYSLGMVAYEYALGQELFKQQFPSVYDPQGSGGGDDRPKWMYFHTSMQMEVPPLKEVIEDYPEDLSDLIAAMMTKPVRERIDSAALCLEKLGDVRGSIAAAAFVEEVDLETLKKKEGKIPKPALFGLIGVVFIALCIAAALVFRSVNAPTITLAQEGAFATDKPKVTISGTIGNYDGTPVEVKLRDNSTWPVQPDDTGAFATEIRVPTVGETYAFLIVFDGFGNQVATRQLDIQRTAPAEVLVRLRTRPSVEGAKVTFTSVDGGAPLQTQTDPSGEAEASIPHGRFKLSVEHPRYQRVADSEYPTHDDPVRSLAVSMLQLSEEALDSARSKLLAQLDEALEGAGNGEAGAGGRLKEIRDALHRLGPGAGRTAPVLQRLDKVVGDVLDGSASDEEIAAVKAEIDAFASAKAAEELGDRPPSTTVQPRRGTRTEQLLSEMASITDRAAAGDPAAKKRLKEIQGELNSIAERALAGSVNERGALLEEAGTLADRAEGGDKRALPRLQEVPEELAKLASGGAVDPVAARRTELIRELDDLAEAAAAGDPVAIARLREVQQELQDLADEDLDSSPEAQRRRALIAELDDLAERAANGDPAAVERMKDVQRQLAALDAEAKENSAEGDRQARREQLLAEMGDLEARAAAGDPAAVARLKEVREELAKLDAQAPQDLDAVAKSERRAALLDELETVAEAAANGDPAAQRRLAEIQQELAALEGDSVENVARADRSARRAALLTEMDALSEAAAAGDPAAIARLAEIEQELGDLNAADVAALDGGPNDARKREILAEMDRLAEAAANGDPAALERLGTLQTELASLDAIDRAGDAPGSSAARRGALVRDLDGAADGAANGDRSAAARVGEIQAELAALEAEEAKFAGGGTDARRAALVSEMESLAERAAAGDPEAAARLAEVQQELAALDGDAMAAAASNERGARRAAILNEMESLAEAAKNGDPEAQARMAELQKELGALNAEELADNGGASRFKKAALLREMDGLAAAAAAGDPQAIARMKEIKNELATLDAQDFAGAESDAGSVANRRAALVREMEGLAEAAANGDRAAQARLAEIQGELKELGAVEGATTAAAAGASKRAALVDELASLEEAAANGDVQAQARIAEIQQELAQIDEASGGAPKAGASQRAALTAELGDLADKAASGDRQAANRLREVAEDLGALAAADGALTAPEAGATKRAALVDEMGSLMDAAARGDRGAQQRIAEIQQELAELEGDEIVKQATAERSAKRQSLVAEMQSLEEAAANGDPAAQARLAEIRQELDALADEELAATGAGAPSAAKAALLQEMKAVAARAAAGDPEAIARLAELQDELEHVDAVEGNAAAEAGSTAARRQALLRELDDVAAAAAAGDPAAKARLAEIQQELAALSEEEVAAGGATEIESKRAALIDELADVQARAAAGDPAAQARLKEIKNELAALDEQERQGSVAARRAALVDELADVQARAAAGDPEAQARLKEIQGELAALDAEEEAQAVAARREALVEELADVQARAAAGDPEAQARLKEIQGELAALDSEEEAQSVAARRAALVDELADVQARAAAGDPAAQARLKEIQQELAQLDAEEEEQSVASRREALVDELADVQARAAAGDPAAQARLKEIQQELAQLDAEEKAGTVASRRAALVAELEDVQKRAAAGDPAAQARLAEIQGELAQLDAEEAQESVEGRRADLLAELDDVQKRAAAGDPAAQARLKEIQGELAKLDAEEEAGTVESRRGRLLAELADVQARAAAGDPAAQARLKEIQKELVALDEEEKRESIQDRRQELLAEIDDLAERAAAGDPAAAARLKEIRGELAQLDAEEEALETGARRAELVAEAESLAARAAAGDPIAQARLKEIQKELGALGEEELAGDPMERRQKLVEKLGELTEAAAGGDAVAAARIKDVKKELQKLEDQESADDAMARRRKLIEEMAKMSKRASDVSSKWELAAALAQMKQVQQKMLDMEADEGLSSDAARRAALVREMEDLTARAASGDKDAAARLKQIQSELMGIEGRSPAGGGGVAGGDMTPAERRQALLEELADVAARAARGDPAAIARMKEIQKELAALEESDPNRGSTLARKRRELVDELGAMTDLAASGNLEAAERVQAIQRELSTLAAIEVAAQNPADYLDATALLAGQVPQLDLIDQQILLDLTPTQFQNFIKINVPHGAIDVEIVSHRSKLRVSGILFDENELARLKSRLKPAEPRIEYEVRVDPWGICRRIEEKLERSGTNGVRVHAHLMPNDHKLFVQYKKERAIGDDKIRAIAAPYVVDDQLLRIQGFRDGARSRR